jgi:hypothetical protein
MMGRPVFSEGRPTIAMETFVRLTVLKARYGWGCRTLVDACPTRCICGASVGSVSQNGCVPRVHRRAFLVASPPAHLTGFGVAPANNTEVVHCCPAPAER